MESGDYTQLPDIMLIQDFAFRKYTIGCPEMFTELNDTESGRILLGNFFYLL